MGSLAAFAYSLLFVVLSVVAIAVGVLFLAYEIDRSSSGRDWLEQVRTRPIPNTIVNALMHLGTPDDLASQLPVIPDPPAKYFPNVAKFRLSWKDIRNEALAVAGQAGEIRNDKFFEGIADDKWRRMYIKWYSDIDPEARKLCPITTSLVESCPEVQLAMFSILDPGSEITPHYGPYKGCLRYHLALEVPKDPGCFIKVGKDGASNTYEWKNGRDVLFDDTYLHYVKNDTPSRRIILFLDVLRPQTTRICRGVRDFVNRRIAPGTTRKNATDNEQAKRIPDIDTSAISTDDVAIPDSIDLHHKTQKRSGASYASERPT